MRRFADRTGAGRELADRLNAYQRRPQAIVLGLARGGVPVAPALVLARIAPTSASSLMPSVTSTSSGRTASDASLKVAATSARELETVVEEPVGALEELLGPILARLAVDRIDVGRERLHLDQDRPLACGLLAANHRHAC